MGGRRAFAVLVAAVGLAVAIPSPASASLSAYNKAVYTKTAANTVFYWHWVAVKGSNGSSDDYRYFLCYKTWHNGTQEEFSNHTNGPGSTNCGPLVAGPGAYTGTAQADDGAYPYTGASYVLADGHQYYMCITGAYWNQTFWYSDSATPSFCPTTVIDRSNPAVGVDVNGTAQYTNNPNLNFHIHYEDAISPPWPANYVCIKVGSACTGSDTFNYDANCSALNQPYSNPRVRDFYCNGDASAQPDGPIYFCAASSDSAIPSNDTGTNAFVYQGTNTPVNSGTSNISNFQCGYVNLDRTAPAVTASANHTTVTVGDLVSFTGGATDGGAGVAGAFDWNFGDNTAHGSGTNVTHSYTTVGTFVASATIADGAGNSGAGNVTITVKPIPPPGTTTNAPPASGTPTGSGTITAPPSTNTISQSAGGGGTQTLALAGLDALAPKTFAIRKGVKKLTLAFTAQGNGGLAVALLKGAKILAKGGANVTKSGTFGLDLKLPKKLTAGKHVIKVSWTPAGASTAQTKTLNIKFVVKKAKKKAKKARSASLAGTVRNIAGAPRYGAARPAHSRPIIIR
jgi:hypothetical protein